MCIRLPPCPPQTGRRLYILFTVVYIYCIGSHVLSEPAFALYGWPITMAVGTINCVFGFRCFDTVLRKNMSGTSKLERVNE